MSQENTTATVIEPIDREGLIRLSERGKANPSATRTLKVKTVLEKKFRHLNYVRDLPVHVIDEPPGLLGDDTAPNPSEAVLAALGSCLSVGIHANAILRKIQLTRVEVELEGDINITAVWGTGDLSEDKLVGFSAVRAKVHLEGDASREELDALVAHADRWSPVANTLRSPVEVQVQPV
jgi:uncharacterized OsmC-like protein